MAIGFDQLVPSIKDSPFLDFLGNAPDRLEAGRIQRARQDILGGINTSNAGSLLAAAQKAFKVGDFEGGKLLLEQGRQLKLAEAQTAAYDIWKTQLGKQQPTRPGEGPVAPGMMGSPDIFSGGAPAPGARPTGDDVFGAPPAAGAGSVLPPGTLGPRTEGPAMPEATERYRLAGPAVAPPISAVPPSYLSPEGLFSRPSTARPGGAPPAGRPDPMVSPRPGEAPPGMGLPFEAAAMDRVRRLADELRQMPRIPANAGAIEAKTAELKAAVEQSNPTKEARKWWNFNIDRVRRGLVPLSEDDYDLRQKFGLDEARSGLKVYDEYQDDRKKYERLAPAISQLDSLLNHEQFETGPGTERWNYMKGLVRSLRDSAKANGFKIDPQWDAAIDRATSSAALREVFNTITNSGIFEKLGSLGAQTSDRDLTFTSSTWPSLRNTKEGNQLILEYYKEIIKRNVQLGKEVQGVYKNFRDRGDRFSRLEIDEIATEYWERPENSILVGKDGSLTPLGQRMQKLKEETDRAAGGPGVMELTKGAITGAAKGAVGETAEPRPPEQQGPLERAYNAGGNPFAPAPPRPPEQQGPLERLYNANPFGPAAPRAPQDQGLLERGFNALTGGGGAPGPAPVGGLPRVRGPGGKFYTQGPDGKWVPVEGP